MTGSRSLGVVAAGALALASVAQSTDAAQIYFSSRKSGEIVKNQYTSSPYSVTVSADNFVPGHPDLAVVFDSNKPQTYDTDLLYPWTTGNLAGKKLNEILIIATNKIDANSDGLIDNPNDEGGLPPAGQLIFKFKSSQKTFGLDLIDIGDYSDEISKSFIQFKKGTTIKKVFLSEFTNPSSVFYDSTITWGNRSANRVKPVLAPQVGLSNFDEVRVQLWDSAAIDNVVYNSTLPDVPEPAAMSLLASPAFLMMRRRRSAT
jgi:hypothetical protein